MVKKRYFKNELKHSKHFDHLTDDVVSLFWSWKKNFWSDITFPQIFSAVW